MKKLALLALCLLSPATLACDTSHLPLSGSISVTTCSPKQDATDCVYASQAVYEYMEAVPDSDALFTIGLQASPWRLYDGDMRILTIDEIADAVRPKLDGKVERVELIASWSGVSPEPGVPSLADQVSKALNGFPVKGEDGFLWLAKDGTRRTTRQAFTVREGAGSYFVPKGSEVLVPLAAGWPAYVQDQVAEDDADMLTRAAAGWDVFFLCPDKALAGFEHAAAKGSAIAAYNAALMRLERRSEADRAAALALLERGAALGDEKSRARLKVERSHN
ncbi:hypothetical protein LVB77_14460 [Lysobacter sp. 5GHs7-4]|uniref:hypothetical protein n=1 Tax=Lysobacter sp. 5GHs7-4 TaxID=2904253 RepID=UPI001E4CC241|nr:hypothetical protein [Lysobacter sp. 5GHs7-4]UHQ21868.1 hypothetical protein LVB77_14460 [Lysobacter sp. 5GHs7-4]